MNETTLNGQSMDIVADNIAKLKAIFPDVFTEGKVDFEKLESVLGNYVEKDNERYNFTWHGKAQALRLAQTPSTGTLRPCKEESKDWDTTQNLYIEGDNLEVLKLLQKSYHNKVKMIYIDPPYNTGKDFVYPDNYKDNIQNYLEITGQVDGDGNKVGTNSEASGRYHTNWLNMMYARLRVARNLLSDDGVIFISIDDKEIDNLKKICYEIFGEDNYVVTLIWQSKSGGSHDEKYVVKECEYIAAIAKNKEKLKMGKQYIDNPNYKLSDKYVNERGKYLLNKLDRSMRAEHFSKALNFSIQAPDGTAIWPGGTKEEKTDWNWRWSKEKVQWGLENGFIEIKKQANGEWGVYSKQYEFCDNKGDKIERLYPYRNLILSSQFNNTQGGSEILDLMNGNVFDYAKPSNLIVLLMKIAQVAENDIVLDFFSGAGTVAHSVLKYSIETNLLVKYILVQLPEKCLENTQAS